MSLFDRLKTRVTDAFVERATKHGASAAKAAAKKSAEACVSAAKGAGRILEEAVYGERASLGTTDDAPKSTDSRAERRRKEEARRRKQEEVGELLRAADQRVRARVAETAEEKRDAAERGASPAEK